MTSVKRDRQPDHGPRGAPGPRLPRGRRSPHEVRAPLVAPRRGGAARARGLWARPVALAAALSLVLAGPAAAQLGLPNVPQIRGPLDPRTQPFGQDPHPFNDPHPAQPWFWPGGDRVVRAMEVPPRTLTLPMEAVQPGSLPSTVEWRTVTLPGYRVTETARGWIVDAHWGVERVGSVYVWTWRPARFVPK